MGLNEMPKMIGAIEGTGNQNPRDEHADNLLQLEEVAGPGGLGISGETAQRMGRRFLTWDPVLGWIPNTAALIDER